MPITLNKDARVCTLLNCKRAYIVCPSVLMLQDPLQLASKTVPLTARKANRQVSSRQCPSSRDITSQHQPVVYNNNSGLDLHCL